MTIEEFCDIATEIHPFVTAIHIREKQKTAKELFLAVQLFKEKNIPLSKIILNDRVDVAFATRVSGVQLTFHSLEAAIVKAHFPQLQLGCSVHSYKEGQKAKISGADYLLYGHVFSSQSKPGLPPKGLEELAKLTELNIPVIAIGGIKPENTRLVLDAGASGIAVMSGVLEADDPLAAVRSYVKEFNNGEG